MKHSLLDFEFLTVLTLLVLLLWPVSGTYTGAQSSIIRTILVIMTVFAVILDIIFLVLRLFT